jgi:glycosyltransferase involved in cell wall biosynthesis
MLAPLRFGAGIKGKLLEAMQCGTPNITTTSIGAESMHGDLVGMVL